MAELPFKKIDLENWLQPDPVSSGFAKGKDEKDWVHYEGEDYLAEVLEPALIPEVPTEVQQLYEMARGMYAYGYFFYPLFTVGMEYTYRAADAALFHLCDGMAVPEGVTNFKRRIDLLVKEKLINSEDEEVWEGIRKLRNTFSHPKQAMFLPPTMAIGSIQAIANAINKLFSKE